MRICLIYQAEYPFAERIHKVARTLTGAGHEVFLLCNNYGGASCAEERVGDVYTIRVRPTFPLRKLNKILKLPVFLNPLWAAQILQTVRRFRIDAIQVIDIPLAPAAWAVGRLLRKPVLMDMWENYPEALRGWAKVDWTRRLFKNPDAARAVEKWVTPRMNHIFTVVDEQKERLIEDGIPPERISVVTNGVDEDLFLAGPDIPHTPLDEEPGAYKLLYVGVFGIERGLDDIIRALRLLQDRIPFIRLYLAGSGQYEPQLRRLVESEGVGHMVRFLGFLPFGEIRSCIVKSDLCLVPHVYNGFINTTIPNKLFQYMAMGKPVLVSHARPLARIVRESQCGFVFQSGDPPDAARQIERAYQLREDPAMGERGRQAVQERYTWEHVSAAMATAYAALAPAGPAAAAARDRSGALS